MEENRKNLKILFDAKILYNYFTKNSERSGIYFATLNLLKAFCKNHNLEITLYYDYRIHLFMQELMRKKVIPQNCILINHGKFFNPIINCLLKLRELSNKENDNFVKKIIRFFIARYFHIYDKIYDKLYFNKYIKQYDIFFSAFDSIPESIKKIKSIKTYQLLHDIIPITMKDFYKNYYNYIKGMELVVKSINSAGTYFTNSQYTKNDVLKYCNNLESNKVIVTYVDVNDYFYPETDLQKIKLTKEKYNIPTDKKYVFSLCTLEPRKNLLFSIKNFIAFIEKNNIDDLAFVLGGAAWKDFLPILEQKLQNFGQYKDKILKIGYVDDEDIRGLYSGAEIFVYPSLYEGFGAPVLEAMRCGCPVITSNTTSLPEVIGEAGIQINPYNDGEMVAAYEKMYFDKNFRESCIKKGLERAKKFSWDKTSKIMIDTFYKEMNNKN